MERIKIWRAGCCLCQNNTGREAAGQAAKPMVGGQNCCWLPFIHPRRRSSCANVEGNRSVRVETRCQAKVAPKSLALAWVGRRGCWRQKRQGKKNHERGAFLSRIDFIFFPWRFWNLWVSNRPQLRDALWPGEEECSFFNSAQSYFCSCIWRNRKFVQQ